MVDFPGLQRFQRMKVSSVGIDIYLDPQTSKPSVLWDRTWLLMPRTETFCGGRFCSCNVVHVITTNEILYNIYTNIRDFWQKIGLSTTTKMFQILCDYWSYCVLVFTWMLNWKRCINYMETRWRWIYDCENTICSLTIS